MGTRSTENAFGDDPIPVAPCACGYQWRDGALPEEVCSHGGGEYVVVCLRCRASGELKATPKWAVEAWNAERSHPSPSPVTDDGLVERDLRHKIALIIDANYHTAISKALSPADQILAASDRDVLVNPDVVRRLKSVATTLETCGKHGIPIDFALLAHDIRAALIPLAGEL